MNELTEKQKEEDLPEDVKATLAKGKAGFERFRRNGLLSIIPFVPTFTMGLIILIRSGNFFAPLIFMLGMLTLELCVIYSLRSWHGKGKDGVDEHDIEHLSSIKDRRIIGVLMDADFFLMNKKNRLRLNSVIAERLRCLTPEGADLLTQKEKWWLAYRLNPSREELTLAIFETLERIGDTNQLAILKSWKRDRLGVPMKPKITEAYKSCITAIEARAASSHSDSQLLRPSFSTDEADTYLRPVTQKIDEDADTLLRAEIGGNDKEAQ